MAKAAMNASGYAEATVPKGVTQTLDDVRIQPSANKGFILTKQYRRTRTGKRAMYSPDYLPPERPMTFDSFDAMVGALRECFGVKAKG